jgi:hypothetical protein
MMTGAPRGAPAAMEPVMTSITARRADTASLERASHLLRLYPDISPEEKGALVRFLKEGPPDDVARLTFGSGLGERITALKKDHPEDFATGPRIWLPLVSFVVAAIAVLVLARVLFE